MIIPCATWVEGDTNLEKFLNLFVYTSVSNVFTPVKNLDKKVQEGFAQLADLLHQYREEYRKILTPVMPPTVEPTTEQS